MSSSNALCYLPLVKQQKMTSFFFRSMYNKTIIRLGFCDIQNNQGLLIIKVLKELTIDKARCKRFVPNTRFGVSKCLKFS